MAIVNIIKEPMEYLTVDPLLEYDGLMLLPDKDKLDGIQEGAEANQNAFSNIVVGSTTIAADSKTDSVTLVAGSNVTLTPDASTDKITIAATDTTYSEATTSTSGLMSSDDKTKLNGIAAGAEVNQNAFSNVKVGSTTVAADSKTDTFELAAGSNVTLTPDATNDKVTIAATDTTYTFSNGTNSFTVTPSGGSAQTVTVTPSIPVATTSANGLMSSDDKTKLNGVATGAEVNQNAFSNVKVGSTTVAADAKTDTIELAAGSNITLTPDATNDKVTIAATDTTYTVATGDSNGQIKVTPSAGNAYNVGVKGLGGAAYKNATTSVTSGSADLITSGAVWTAIDNLPEPMIFKGSLGTGGTITTLPAASSANTGHTYKVITAGTYASQAAKVGDLFISDGSAWVYIPSADEPSGTVTSIAINATSPIAVDSSAAITTSGTRTISHANSGVTAGTYKSVTVNATGHVTGGSNPTTIAGYGITDAKIANGTITLGSNSITPLTSFTETDPTVPSWAKAASKPTYTAAEVGAATSGHTHATSIATSTGTNQISLAANTKYAISAGGTSYVFTTPADTNTWRGIQNNLTSDSTDQSLSAAQGKALANGSARDNTKVAKTGDTMTGNLTIKNTTVDASKANNNVSSTVYPTSFCVLDSADRILAREEAIIESNGNISNYFYVRNYNTSGTSIAQKGIRITVDKSGNATWTVDDGAKFRTAIGAGTSSFSGSYNDLTNKPTIPAAANNGTLTIQKNGTNVQTFTANQSTNVTANITVPTTAADIGAATSGHTHATSIATSTGTNQLTMAANTKYSITAGGTSYIFTTPPDTNTLRGIQNNLTSNSISDSLSAAQGKALANGSARDSTKLPLAGGSMTGTLTFNKVANAISYTGTKATYSMIKFKDNTNDEYGNGIVIGGGGLTVIGGGESADTVAATHTTGGDEILELTSDGNVQVLANVQDGTTNAKKLVFNTSGNFTAPGTISASQFIGVPVLPVNPTTKPTTVGAMLIEA